MNESQRQQAEAWEQVYDWMKENTPDLLNTERGIDDALKVVNTLFKESGRVVNTPTHHINIVM